LGSFAYLSVFAVLIFTLTAFTIQDSHATGGANFQLSPTSGPAGIPVNIIGSGFAPSSTIYMYYDSSYAYQTGSSDASGNAAFTFLIPASTIGDHTIKAVDSSSNEASQNYTVVAPTFAINPTSGPAGIPVNIIGSGFAPSSTIYMYYDSSYAYQTGSSDASGNAAFTFYIPASTIGDHTIKAVDTYSNEASQKYTQNDIPTISISDVTVVEGTNETGNFNFVVTRSGDSTGTSSVSYFTSDVTAKAGSDYQSIPITTLNFAPGETKKTITVLVYGDTTPEFNEVFNVNLSNCIGCYIVDNLGVGTIQDDTPIIVDASTCNPLLGGAWDGVNTCTITKNIKINSTKIVDVLSDVNLVLKNSDSGIDCGSIYNSGTITIANSGLYGIDCKTINNYGAINIENTGNIGISCNEPNVLTGISTILNNFGGNITIANSGSQSEGIHVCVGGKVNNYSGGKIIIENSDGYGIYGDPVSAINNFGTIVVKNTGGYGIAYYLSLSTLYGLLNNDGNIQISNTAGIGIFNGGVLRNSGTIEIFSPGGTGLNSRGCCAFDPNPIYNTGQICDYTTQNQDGSLCKDLSLDEIGYVQSAGGTDDIIKNKPGIIFFNVTSTFSHPQNVQVAFDFFDDGNSKPSKFGAVSKMINPGKNTFYFSPGLDNGLGVPTGKNYTIQVVLVPPNQIKDGIKSNNQMNKTYAVKETQPLKVLFVPIDWADSSCLGLLNCDSITPIGDVKAIAYASKNFVEAMYPLETGQFDFKIGNTLQVVVPSGTTKLAEYEIAKFAQHDGFKIGVGVVDPRIFCADIQGKLNKTLCQAKTFVPIGVGGQSHIGLGGILVSDWDITSDSPGLHYIHDETIAVAHEMGHSLGFIPTNHTLECKKPNITWRAHHSCINLSNYGFDLSSDAVMDTSKFDIMGYNETQWIDKTTYDFLFTQLKVAGDPTVVEISGKISKNGTVTLDPWYKLDGTPTLPLGSTGNYTIDFVDQNQNVLASTGFDLTFSLHSDPNPSDPTLSGYRQVDLDLVPFVFTIPYADGAHSIEIKDSSGKKIAERIISPNPPSVKVITPNGGDHFLVGQKISLEWNATDSDTNPVQPLYYAADISYDNGTDWLPITMDYSEKKLDFTIPPTNDTNEAILRVSATDGINTSEDVSDSTFSISSAHISINDVSLTEGDSGTKSFNFTVTRSDNTTAVSVQYNTTDGTATSSDYTAIPSNTINFAAGGSLNQTVTVLVNGDTAAEPDETFNVNLSNCTGGNIADNQGVGTILNDDSSAPPGTISDGPSCVAIGGTWNGIDTCTITNETNLNADKSVTIPNGVNLAVSNSERNSVGIRIFGTLNNSGTITIANTRSVGIGTVGGIINNYGTITIENNGSSLGIGLNGPNGINNYGTIKIANIAQGSCCSDGIENNYQSTINNNGIITVSNIGDYGLVNYGTLNNYGILKNVGFIFNNGIILNCGGTIIGTVPTSGANPVVNDPSCNNNSQTPIVVDTSTYSTTASSSTLDFPVTVNSGTDRFLYVGITLTQSGVDPPHVTSVTYGPSCPGSQSLGPAVAPDYNPDNSTSVEQWTLVAQSVGTNNVCITLSGNADRISAGAVSLAGVDQTNPVANAARNVGISDSSSGNFGGHIGDLDVATLGIKGAVVTAASGQLLWNNTVISGSTDQQLTSLGNAQAPSSNHLDALNYLFSTSASWVVNVLNLQPVQVHSSANTTATIVSLNPAIVNAGEKTTVRATVVPTPLLIFEQPQFFTTAVILGTDLPADMNFCLVIGTETLGCANTDSSGSFGFNFIWPTGANNASNVTVEGSSNFTGTKTPNVSDTTFITIPLSPQGTLTIQERAASSSIVVSGKGFPANCSFELDAGSQSMGGGNSFDDGNWGFNFGDAVDADNATQFTWIGQGTGDCSQSLIFYTTAGGPYPKNALLPGSATPTGNVTFNDGIPSAGGTFSSTICSLPGTNELVCIANYTAPNTGGFFSINADYSPGNSNFAASSGSNFLFILGSPPPSTAQVIMSPGAGSDQSCVVANNCFSPNVVNINQGDTVTWKNNDTVSHTTTSGNPSDNQTGTIWDSGLIAPGSTFSFTFQNAGDYHYHCMVHPWMTGEVLVGGSIMPNITINDVLSTEGNSGTKLFNFTITRSDNTTAVSVQYNATDGTATSPSDYTAIAQGRINFTAGGSLTQTVTVPVNGDTAVEQDETFNVNLSNCTGCNITDNQGVGTIQNDDSSPATKLYGTDGSGGHLLAIDPSTGIGTVVGPMGIGPVPALAIDPTTGIMYAGGGAGTPNLYVVNKNTGGATLVGNSGLGIAAIGDLAFRSDDTLFAVVNIAGDGRTGSDHLATIDKSTGAATIIGPFGNCTGVTVPSDGSGSCTIEGIEGIAFDASGTLWGSHTVRGAAGLSGLYTIDTTTGAATFVAPILNSTGSPPSGGVASLQFIDGTLYGGTATAIAPATDGGRLVVINSTTGSFTFAGTNATGGSSLASLAAKIAQTPLPSEPNISINDVSLTEGISGSKNFNFTVTRSDNTTAVSVQYNTTDGTATSSDYTAIPLTTINFTAGGSLTQTVTVLVNGDTAVEQDETFNVNLSNCTGCNITDSQGVGTIQNDDSNPVAYNQTASTTENTEVTITLNGTDKDAGDILTFSTATNPVHGSLTAGSTVRSFSAFLNGSQEVPVNPTVAATGTGNITYNDTSMMLTYHLSYDGLSSSETGAHIHLGVVGVDGPIIFPLSLGNPVSGTVGPLSVEQQTALYGGNLYVNVHSSLYPGGEIRGQIISTGNASSSVTYSPSTNYFGPDSFTYKVNDGAADSNIATVTISIRSASPPPPILSSIAITTPATKLTYTVGDQLDTTGLVINGTFSDNSTSVVAFDNVTGFDSTVPAANQTLTVHAGSQTTTYTVDIVAAPVTLSSIAITHPTDKLVYTVGDQLDTTGLVINGTFSDNSTSVIAFDNVTGFDSTVPAANQTLTVHAGSQTTTYSVDIVGATPKPNISINDVSLTEGNSGNKKFDFTVTRNDNTTALSVQYNTTDGTATSPSDYTAIPLTTINFTAGGSLTQTVTVLVNGDTAVEQDETFNVNLSNCTGCNITDNQGVGTILNDDSSPPPGTIFDGPSCVAIGGTWNGLDTCTVTSLTINSGETLVCSDIGLIITGSLTIDSGGILNINCASGINNLGIITNSGTINNNSGGIGNSGTMTNFGTINNDSPGGIANELTLINSGTINMNLARITNNGTITNTGDINTNFVGVAIDNSATINNSGSINNKDATIQNNLDSNITNSGTITNTGGIVSNSGTITNNLGGSITNFGNIANFGTITNDCGATITNNGSITGNPVNFIACPGISINNVSLTEGNSGTKLFNFTITRSDNATTVSVQYNTTDGTATSPSDYTAIPLTTINFTAGGSLSQTVTVPVNGDIAVEPDETFNVNLSNCTGCNITDSQGVGTIQNDDSPPLSPAQQTNNLINTKHGMNLPYGISNSLDAKLNAVLNSLNSHQNNTAKNQLSAFIHEVNAQAGKKIPQAQASQLIQDAQNIINSIH